MKRYLFAIGFAVGGAVLLIGGGMVLPRAAHACSGPEVTMDDVSANARLVFAGTVVSSPHAGGYEISVEEVFRGSVDPVVVIGLEEPSDVAQLCSHVMEVGDRVAVAQSDRSNLGLFSAAIWYLLPDGTVGSVASELPAETHEELFSILRMLPDTALPAPSPGSPLVPAGAAILLLLASAVGARSVLGRSRAMAGDPAPTAELDRSRRNEISGGV